MKNYIILFGQFLINLLIALRTTYWNLIGSKLTKIITVRLSKEDKLRIHSYGDIARSLYSKVPLVWLNRGFEYRTLAKIKENVKLGDTVFDIGANIGMYSIILSKLVGKEGKVYSFEPDPQTAYFLKKNLKLNGCDNVIVSQIALSDENGKVFLKKPEGAGDAFNFISGDKPNTPSDNSVDAVKVDDFINLYKIEKLNFVKIDIEGAELLCMKGGTEVMLAKLKPIIVTEVFEPYCDRFGYLSFDLLKLIHSFGYTLTNYEEHQWYARANTFK